MENMVMKFKIIYGFGKEKEITIDENELEKAYGIFLLGGRAVFGSDGAVDGKYIMAIRPDYRATMGWNMGYELNGEDMMIISQKKIDRKLQIAQARAKERVDYLIANKQERMIGKNAPIPQLERDNWRAGELKSIGEIIEKKDS